jgi:hypothetical protein
MIEMMLVIGCTIVLCLGGLVLIFWSMCPPSLQKIKSIFEKDEDF